MGTPIVGVDKAAQKFGLDTAAAFRLADSLERREDPVEDLRKICTHLERSNKPSAMAMKLLKDLREGNVVEECTHAPSIGSFAHKQETFANAQQQGQNKGDRGQRKERDRSQKRQRDKSRSRRKSRSKSRARRRKSSSSSSSRKRSRSRRRR